MKVVYSGLEDSGKSLKLARVASDVLYRNAAWQRLTGVPRPIISNIAFSQSFLDVAKEEGVEVRYWKDLSELVVLTDADVFIDEVGTYFDSRMWESLSLDIRRWLAQSSKMGVDIYGTAQDFAQVDKSFRRLCNSLFLIRKVMGSNRPSKSKPPVKRVWGLCSVTELDPESYEEDDKRAMWSIPSFFVISKRYTSIFDTQQRIAESAPPPLKKIVRVCPEDGYKKIRYV